MRIGLFGGTFSPPHLGHTRAARCFVEDGELDKLIVMPTYISPHKVQDEYGTPEIRLELAHLAFDGLGEVSDYEIKQGGKSFTYLTLRYLRSEYPDAQICLCVGEDMFLSLDSWREADELMKNAEILCLMRENGSESIVKAAKAEFEEAYGAKIKILKYSPLPVSSSEVRTKCASGEEFHSLVPTKVYEYIVENELYITEDE